MADYTEVCGSSVGRIKQPRYKRCAFWGKNIYNVILIISQKGNEIKEGTGIVYLRIISYFPWSVCVGQYRSAQKNWVIWLRDTQVNSCRFQFVWVKKFFSIGTTEGGMLFKTLLFPEITKGKIIATVFITNHFPSDLTSDHYKEIARRFA